MKFFLRKISYLLCVHGAALAVLSIFRLVFFLAVRAQLTPDVAGRPALTLTAFVRGLWFDNVIACYVAAVPLLIIIGAGVLGRWRAGMWRVLNGWYGVLYALVFMAAAGNIPYFAYFARPLNASIWNWAEYGGQTLGMIFGEASYYLYIALYFLLLALFSSFLYALRRRFVRWDRAERAGQRRGADWAVIVGTSAVLGGLCFLGIRGRTGYNPIKVSAAYFSTSPVLNNLGVNATFALLNSTLDELRPENQTLHLMPDDEALREVQRALGRTGIDGISPIARSVRPDSAPQRRNVVVVLMESMSARLMTRFGNDQRLTPCLDSLYRCSLSFANCYSAGNHTNHGLYATLYSFPSIMFRNAMKGTDIPRYAGLPTVLREAGYATMFFMTHESQYDNMNAFFRTNGYEEIYAQENYPKEEVVNHFGVPDDYLFSYALPVLRRHAASGCPFFATLLTISNHPPYVVPEAWRDAGLQPEEQIVRYADDCLRRFMQRAMAEEWGRHTLFVLLGDHGKLLGRADTELPESFNHIPLIFHAEGLRAEERTQFAGQVDVAPTLLGLLGISYTQNNLGLDLLRDAPRPYAFYTADKTIAARAADRLYVYNQEQGREYCYRITGGRYVPTAFSPSFRPLKDYVLPLLQTTEYMVENGMTTNRPRKQTETIKK